MIHNIQFGHKLPHFYTLRHCITKESETGERVNINSH